MRSNSAPESETAPIRRLGDYELIEEIARGGMGVVFRARQVSLDREVAVKLMREAWLAKEEDIRRFRAEAAAASKLRHPNIIAIHEVGEEDGLHYFAMDIIEGKNLAECTRERPLTVRDAAEIMATVSEALQHAHDHGILHRDLKPSNVLLDGKARPFVTDFGLTRRFDTESSLTGTDQILGTPGYMPPEQATGKGTVGPGADIYSLGAVLYHLLTGRPPFVAGTTLETLRHVVELEPVSPKLLNPEVPRSLASICLKCLSKSPSDRYASAQALADDLHRFLRGEPIWARPTGRPERLWRWCQRRPALAGISLLAIAALLGMTFSIPAYHNAERSRSRETAQRHKAEAALQVAEIARQAEIDARRREKEERMIAQAALGKLRKTDYSRNLTGAAQDVLAGDFSGAEDLLDECAPDLRGWEWHYLKHLSVFPPQGTNSIAFSTNGAMWGVGFDTAGTGLVCLGETGRTFCNLTTGAQIFSPHDTRRGRMAFHPKNAEYAVGSPFSDHCTIFQTLGIESATLLPEDHVYDLSFSPDGEFIVTCRTSGARGGGEVKLWRSNSRTALRTVAESTNGFTAVRFSPDGRLIAASDCSWGNSINITQYKPTIYAIRIWDVASGQLMQSLEGHRFAIWRLVFTPDSKHLVSSAGIYSGGTPGEIKFWDLQTGKEIFDIKGHRSCVFALAVSPDGTRLASGGGGQAGKTPEAIRLWDLSSGSQVFSLKGHSGSIFDLAFSPSGNILASASNDGSARIWDATPVPNERQLGLSNYYNASPSEAWFLPSKLGKYTLADLPQDLQRLGGVRFKIGGIIQLKSDQMESAFPRQVSGIPVSQRCGKMHFLHSALSTVEGMSDGQTVGTYVVHYTDGQTASIPIIYGEDLREWQVRASENTGTSRAVRAWSKDAARIYRRTWTNALPEMQIETLDFVSAMTHCAPFLIAVTVE